MNISTVPDGQGLQALPSLEVQLLNRRITFMTVRAIVEAIHGACLEKRKIVVANYNIHSFNLSMHLPWFYQFLQQAEITHCDSVGILRAIHYLGLELPLQYRTSYTLLMPELLELCHREGLSLFLLGATPPVLDGALERLRLFYPNIHLDGHHGYFTESGPVIDRINRFGAQVLLVGMGMPLQEHWVSLHKDQLEVNATLVGGAVIDRLAGMVPDCPSWLSNAGLEWFYRLCREPKRLSARYLLGNPAFALQIALAKFTSRPGDCLEVLTPGPLSTQMNRQGSLA